MLPRHRQRAFTLVELSLCIAIIIVLSAVAMPRYASAISSYRARAAARRLAADLTQVQTYARTSSTSRTISFDMPNAAYQITNLRDFDTIASTYRVLLSAEPYKSSIATISMGAGSQIIYDGYGNPDRGGSITIQSGTTTRIVSVDANTGRVSVQ